jgi:hypothetical protein
MAFYVEWIEMIISAETNLRRALTAETISLYISESPYITGGNVKAAVVSQQ